MSTPLSNEQLLVRVRDSLSELVDRDVTYVHDRAQIRFASNSQAMFVVSTARSVLNDVRSALKDAT